MRIKINDVQDQGSSNVSLAPFVCFFDVYRPSQQIINYWSNGTLKTKGLRNVVKLQDIYSNFKRLVKIQGFLQNILFEI